MNKINSNKLKNITAWWFLLPAVILVLVFVFYPTLYSLHLSFFKWNGISAHKKFVGFANYMHIFKDRILFKSIINTAYFVVVTMFIQSGISLILALFIEAETNQKLKTLYRVIFFFPALISVSIVALMWSYVYDVHNGLLNNLFNSSIFWLSNKHLVLPAIITVNIWQWTGFNAIIFTAGITAIPKSLYEAAEIEGATPYHKFVGITLPLLKGTIAIVLITTMINGLKTYDLIKVLTNGGPNHASEFIATHIYNVAFELKKLGRATALGYALTLVSALLSILYFKVTNKKS